MTQQQNAAPDPYQQYLEQLLGTNTTAWELFRMGYETGLAHSIDHERLARSIRAMELNYAETKTLVKSTTDFIDVLAHRQRAGSTTHHPRRGAA